MITYKHLDLLYFLTGLGIRANVLRRHISTPYLPLNTDTQNQLTLKDKQTLKPHCSIRPFQKLDDSAARRRELELTPLRQTIPQTPQWYLTAKPASNITGVLVFTRYMTPRQHRMHSEDHKSHIPNQSKIPKRIVREPIPIESLELARLDLSD